MSDQISAFAEKIGSDDDVRSALVALHGTTPAELPDKIAALASSNGFSISADEVKDYIISRSMKPVNLTDEALTSNPPHTLEATYTWPGC